MASIFAPLGNSIKHVALRLIAMELVFTAWAQYSAQLELENPY